ncbi:hypothetical protein [Desulfobacter latus]|uniref:Uncharacterized protein n=1 Tax=Desulfobacter latus TaxID=2292 RepID=A0A850STT7_9BACT|nr:hypothetical protein [Desulfobacter latus]NWH04569.1 hypothetical protein [Desulfobacter latus]
MTKIAIRIVGIGMLHSFLYGYLVPFVIYPHFGRHGIAFAVIVAILISIGIMATLKLGKSKKKRTKESDP